MKGLPFLGVRNGSAYTYPDSPLDCFVSIRRKGGEERFGTSKASVSGVPDSHELFQPIVPVIFNCPLEFAGDEPFDWEESEIFVAISLPGLEPPADVFSPVTLLPVLDPVEHRTGKGPIGVCLPPLSGEIYAPFIKDFIAYYQALGFTHFFPYLFNPGPKSLAALRDVALEDGIEPIRWGIPKGWTYGGLKLHKPLRNFEVDPVRWDIPGVPTLPPKRELTLGGTANHEFDITLWYYGQGAAQQDCQFRAMEKGLRWVTHVDWNEYLLLRPANSHPYPPPATSAGGSAFTEWARTVQTLWTTPDTLRRPSAEKLGVNVAEETRDMLPASFTFVSAFACIKCRPTDGPPEEEAALEVRRAWPGLDWRHPSYAIPLAFTSPVRQGQWFGVDQRTKAVVDPWAWWSVGIHLAGLGYAEHATDRGICSSSASHARRSPSDVACAKSLLRTLGRNTVLVHVPPPTLLDAPPGMQFATGGLLHFRVEKEFASKMTAWNDKADEGRWDAVEGVEGRTAFSGQRVDKPLWGKQLVKGFKEGTFKNEADELVQDWSLVDVHGAALVEILKRKKQWGVTKWFGEKRRKLGTGRKNGKRRVGDDADERGWYYF